MKWYWRLLQEVLIVALIGCAPTVVAYRFGGFEMFNSTILATFPAEPVFWYFVTLSVVYALVVGSYRVFSEQADLTGPFISVLREAGTTFHAIWRVIAGGCLTIPFVLVNLPDNSSKASPWFFVGSGLLFFGLCVLLSFCRAWVEGPSPKPVHSANN